MALQAAIQQLKTELENKNLEVKKIGQAIQLLEGNDPNAPVQKKIGRIMSPEAIAKIRASRLKYWKDKKKALQPGKRK